MTPRTLLVLLALASVDLATGGVYLVRFWEGIVSSPLQWSSVLTGVLLAFFVPGIATVLLTIGAYASDSSHTGGVRAVLSVGHAALGGVLVFGGMSSRLIQGGGTVIWAPELFLIVPGAALIVVGGLSLAWLRLGP